MIRFHWSDIVCQLKIELVNQLIECAGPHIRPHFCHDKVDGRGSVLTILRNG